MEHDDLERRLGALGHHPVPTGLASEHLTRIAGAGTPSRWHGKLRVGAAFLAGLLLGGSGLVAAGALPDPVQHAAHQALDRVGVEVPDPERYHGEECGDEVRRNHGAYVRDDHSLARSRCGKPVSAGTEGDDAGGPKEKGPCQGPPPWAGPDKADMTPEEKAAAQAAREAECGAEEADAGAAERESGAEPEADATTTTTVAAEETTTSTTAETTTTAGDGSTTTETTAGG
jgi:hypothetical protein